MNTRRGQSDDKKEIKKMKGDICKIRPLHLGKKTNQNKTEKGSGISNVLNKYEVSSN